MSRVIWKFPVSLLDRFNIRMPQGAEILCLQTQLSLKGEPEPQLWALVDPAAPLELRKFILAGTGHSIPDVARRYVGTFQLGGGSLILHLFEERPGDKVQLLDKTYDANSAVDFDRDMAEVFRPDLNPPATKIATDKHGFIRGSIRVQIEYEGETA